MSVDLETEGGFRGNRRQGSIYYRLFTLLSGYDGHYKSARGRTKNSTGDEMVFSWLIDVKGWCVLNESDAWFFASLARALPDSTFLYDMCLTEEIGPGDQSLGHVEYEDGNLSFWSALRFVSESSHSFTGECPYCSATLVLDEDEEGESEYECPNCGEIIDLGEIELEEDFEDDDEDDEGYDEQDDCFECHVDKDGTLTGMDSVVQQCLASEKQALSDLLILMETGTEDPRRLLDLGMIFETGLGGVEKNLTLAWDWYLKAAAAGDGEAVAFVSEIFADENREELRALLENKNISKKSYPVFFDLGRVKNDPALTAELLDYKGSLGE